MKYAKALLTDLAQRLSRLDVSKSSILSGCVSGDSGWDERGADGGASARRGGWS